MHARRQRRLIVEHQEVEENQSGLPCKACLWLHLAQRGCPAESALQSAHFPRNLAYSSPETRSGPVYTLGAGVGVCGDASGAFGAVRSRREISRATYHAAFLKSSM